MRVKRLILIILLFKAFFALSQDVNPYDTCRVLPPEIILGNHVYKTQYNWLLAGAGFSSGGVKKYDSNMAIDYHFRIKGKYYQVGVMRSKELMGFFPPLYDRLFYDIHIGFGKKKDRIKWSYAFFAGPSLINARNYIYQPAYLTAGGQAQLQLIYKPVFDVGLAASLYLNANFKYSCAGLRLCLFFSNSHKGKLNEYLK